ncbi:MAG: hypothetical protein V1695_00960 [Candidatus Uhrbacteria bacterium]
MNRFFLRVVAQFLRLKEHHPRKWKFGVAFVLIAAVVLIITEPSLVQAGENPPVATPAPTSNSGVGFFENALVWLAGF